MDIKIKPWSNEQRDYQLYYVRDVDPNFSPEKNKFVIDKTIKEYERKRKQKDKQFTRDLDERSQAVYQYLRHLDKGHSTPLEKYFGKKTLAHLRGERIRTIIRPDGSRVFEEIN